VNLSYTDAVTEDDIEAIWALYNELKSFISTEDFKKLPGLIRAALIGRTIGMAIDQNGLVESLGFERVIEDLFSVDGWNLDLKLFELKDDLKTKQYPERSFSKDVEISWSLI
jgi:hypothetical protein